MEKPGELVVYALGWNGDHPIEGDEEAGALFHGRVVIDGVELRCASGCEIKTEGGDFATATIHILVKSAKVVGLTKEQFDLEDLSAVAS